MPGVTKEQVAAARRMTAIEFLRRYRADDLVKSSARGEFELKSHDSFKINGESSLWHWKSRGIGGKSALDYLVHVEGCSFVEAVRLLCDEQPVFTPQKHADVERKRPPFKLPEKSQTTTRVEAYLRCRGISQPVIQKCLDDGILYESLPYHNCVFVGRDENGITRSSAKKSCVARFWCCAGRKPTLPPTHRSVLPGNTGGSSPACTACSRRPSGENPSPTEAPPAGEVPAGRFCKHSVWTSKRRFLGRAPNPRFKTIYERTW